MGVGALGQSLTPFGGYSYSTISAALVSHAQSGVQTAAYSTLPASSPFPSLTYLSVAQQEALGLRGNDSVATAGWVGLASMYSFGYGSGTPSAGQYYFQGVVEHEFTEVMGRVSLLNYSVNSIMDLFRYSGAGTRQTGTGAASYFSYNNGVTNLNNWNNYVTGNSGDLGDWAPSAGNDAFNDNSSPGVINGISTADIKNMNVIGWNEPTSVIGTGSSSVVSGNVVASNGVIQDGSSLTVENGGTTYDTLIAAGGNETVLSGGLASATIVGGTLTLEAGATAIEAYILSGTEIVEAGAATSATGIAGGALLVQSGGSAGDTVYFDGGGLLAFEDSASFHGSIVGFDSWSHIDFADISFSSTTTVGYSGNDSSGILQVSDGAHSAQLALIGQYTAASFTLAGDGHGGTMLGAVSGIGTPPVAYDPGTPSPGPSEPLPNTGFLYG